MELVLMLIKPPIAVEFCQVESPDVLVSVLFKLSSHA